MYTYLLFEYIDENEKHQLGYASLDMINYYNHNNIEHIHNSNDAYIELIKILLDKNSIKYDNVIIIQVLTHKIEKTFHLHFQIILDQENDLTLKLEPNQTGLKNTDNNDCDYDCEYNNDENEYIYNLSLNESTESTELDNIIKFEESDGYDLEKYQKHLEYMLDDYDIDYWNNNSDDIMEDEELTTQEYEVKLQKIIKINNLIKKRIEQINLIKNYFTKEFIQSKIVDADNKIKNYFKIKNFDNVDQKKINLKIATQLCRKFKYLYLNQVKFNFVVLDYYTEIGDNSDDINYYIKISNVNKTIIGEYKKEQFGNYKSGYDYNIYSSIVDIKNKNDVVDDDITDELFKKLDKFLF